MHKEEQEETLTIEEMIEQHKQAQRNQSWIRRVV